jgi:hypothetical protein
MQDSAQDGVLENVGKTAGMKGMTIIQNETLSIVSGETAQPSS